MAGSRVFVVDDDASVRKSLERLIRSARLEVESFASASEFLDRDTSTEPCCLVLDVRMPGLNGLELQQLLALKRRAIPIVFITGHGDIPMSVKAMKAGAIDFIQKPFEDRDLLSAVRRALEQDVRASQERAGTAAIQQRIDMLTPREHEVFRWVLTGMLNKQIAFQIGTSEKTVKVHRGRMMKKLRVGSVADLVRLAQMVGVTPSSA
jgi:FixJ family two-component response regulator